MSVNSRPPARGGASQEFLDRPTLRDASSHGTPELHGCYTNNQLGNEHCMRCVGCGRENRPERRFCAGCGAALPVACVSCGFANEVDEQFCGGCGRALVSSAADVAGPEEPRAPARDAERRQLTVLFCDLVGSTECRRASTRRSAEIVRAYQTACGDAIRNLWPRGAVPRRGLLVTFYPARGRRPESGAGGARHRGDQEPASGVHGSGRASRHSYRPRRRGRSRPKPARQLALARPRTSPRACNRRRAGTVVISGASASS
jgi:hypothetical protein